MSRAVFTGLAVLALACATVPLPETVRDACIAGGDAFCDLAVRCAHESKSTHGVCTSEFMKDCCADDETCDEASGWSDRTEDQWNDCLHETRSRDCDLVEVLPASCQ